MKYVEDLRDVGLVRLCRAVSRVMYRKLRQKEMEGYGGWDDPNQEVEMRDWFMDHAYKALDSKNPDDFVDVMNFAAFLWNMYGGKD